MRKVKVAIIMILIILLCIILALFFTRETSELKTIKSEKDLLRIYENDTPILEKIAGYAFGTPYMFVELFLGIGQTSISGASIQSSDMSTDSSLSPAETSPGNVSTTSSSEAETSSTKDFSTTNIQVENVDEADITKTDGDYIYSISEDSVIITNVIDSNNIQIASKITFQDGSMPEDLILYNNKLIVIAEDGWGKLKSQYNYNSNTNVKIYNIENKEAPELLKNYELHQPYYTSRCIDNQLYVIASGVLREEEEDKIDIYYQEDGLRKAIEFDNMKYLEDVKTRQQTLFSVVDLNNVEDDISVDSYLIDISNAYVSEKAVYLLDEKYGSNSEMPISALFGLKGIFGAIDYEGENEIKGTTTEIYKFNIEHNGELRYGNKTRVKGRTINQYSLDEYNGHLRVALYDNDGARVVILDENLGPIGESQDVAKGETMYSSRFMGEKAYLVTYKTMDPLFVIDLSNEAQPRVLGELKIPGYSTYLHPYDDEHIIGIGIETQEVVNRDSSTGRIRSTSSKIIGMKMALFDVSDVNNPIEIGNTIIGDKRTTSAILTNPKALLFSKEKSLIAIPVNNYTEDFEVDSPSGDSYSSAIKAYTSYDKEYVGEGYLVYNIDIENGFNLKGTITHEESTTKNSYYYRTTRYNSKLLRGLYIEDNLYTVSEKMIKVNNLDTLELINELKIEEYENNNNQNNNNNKTYLKVD